MVVLPKEDERHMLAAGTRCPEKRDAVQQQYGSVLGQVMEKSEPPQMASCCRLPANLTGREAGRRSRQQALGASGSRQAGRREEYRHISGGETDIPASPISELLSLPT